VVNRPSTALRGLRHHIDAVIGKNPTATVTAVWEHLVDDHDATVSYGAVRAYVTKRRPRDRQETTRPDASERR
jgi:hypothetical protein